MDSYDLIAIGSGPAGQAAALEAAALGRRAAVVERPRRLGGLSTMTGTVPLHAIRAAIAALGSPAFRARELAADDLFWRTRDVVEREQEAVCDRLRHGGVHVLEGNATFVDPHTLAIRRRGATTALRADRFVLAVGTTPTRPSTVDAFAVEDILGVDRLPNSLVVVGGGHVGLEIAAMAAALGIAVTLVERSEHVLEHVDHEIVEALVYHLRGLGLTLRLRAEAVSVERVPDGSFVTRLHDGTTIATQAALWTPGRRGATAELGLAAAGVAADERGRVPVDAELRTAQRHIFAAGDVAGGPARTATALEQGRVAVRAAFGLPTEARPVPLTVATIPEIACVGAAEQELVCAGVPYVVGRAEYRGLMRARIDGERAGLLKLLVHAGTREVVGVHAFGALAGELVHTGRAAIAAGLSVDALADAAETPTSLGDAYRVAALDAATELARSVAA